MKYRIAIPSHRRAGILKEKTLSFLGRASLGDAEVKVFCSDEQDVSDYAGIDAELVLAKSANVAEKFNFIHRYYPKGERVFVMEDDVELIAGVGNKKATLTDLETLVALGFENIGRGGLFGVAPHDNSFFFSGRVKDGLMLVVAHAFGFVSTNDPRLEVSQICKSDYERTCLYFEKYGRVVRVDTVGVRTKSYTQSGGMQSDMGTDGRRDCEAAACAYLCKRFPYLLSLNKKKKSIFEELRFRRMGGARDR